MTISQQIKAIKNNPANKKFFGSAEFHKDKEYDIIKNNNGESIFKVITEMGNVYYELDGISIEKHISLKNI